MELRPPVNTNLGSSSTGQVQFMFRNLVCHNKMQKCLSLLECSVSLSILFYIESCMLTKQLTGNFFSTHVIEGEIAASQFTQKDIFLGNSTTLFTSTLIQKVFNIIMSDMIFSSDSFNLVYGKNDMVTCPGLDQVSTAHMGTISILMISLRILTEPVPLLTVP